VFTAPSVGVAAMAPRPASGFGRRVVQ
jgi:hypothetical protein